jgi:uncharacterized protein (DUF433 family)
MATKHPLIESDPAVMGAKPVVAGTASRSSLSWKSSRPARRSKKSSILPPPRLTRESILAALAFAAEALRADVVYPAKSAAE